LHPSHRPFEQRVWVTQTGVVTFWGCGVWKIAARRPEAWLSAGSAAGLDVAGLTAGWGAVHAMELHSIKDARSSRTILFIIDLLKKFAG
jgi:hypothetical protein